MFDIPSNRDSIPVELHAVKYQLARGSTRFREIPGGQGGIRTHTVGDGCFTDSCACQSHFLPRMKGTAGLLGPLSLDYPGHNRLCCGQFIRRHVGSIDATAIAGKAENADGLAGHALQHQRSDVPPGEMGRHIWLPPSPKLKPPDTTTTVALHIASLGDIASFRLGGDEASANGKG